MSFTLPKLPYAMDALQPMISKETLEYHYGKHHQTYVTKLNGLAENTPFAKMSLEEVIIAAREQKKAPVFNNAAQTWNHSFYWECLDPKAPKEPTGSLRKAIEASFGSWGEFQTKFTDAAVNLFGSGWAWLVRDGNKVAIVQTSNAETPLGTNQRALLTCDVWEHAYYIDYRNARPKYMENFWKLVNWDFVAKNFG